MLKGLSRSQQVICIKHLPQIAAFADRHFFVKKRIRDERTVTRIKVLEGDERIDEIARMLGVSPLLISNFKTNKETAPKTRSKKHFLTRQQVRV